MQALKNTRNQWIEAYYSGNHALLEMLETDEFFVQENNRMANNDLRYQQIKNLVKQGKWQPERLLEKDLQFHQLSATEYRVTGIVYSTSIQISIEEKWQLENGQWRAASLIMTP